MQRPSEPSKDLKTFPNPAPENDYTIKIRVPEFTCLCPLTGQPDFAKFLIEYVPEKECLELKSLKMYFWSFRDERGFHEKLTNDILAALTEATQPRFMRITAKWNVRGGIFTTVTAEHRASGWNPPGPVALP